MSYLRVKWIKGNPYLYEQASYRVGKQVKTKHIRYVGKYGYQVSGASSGGFQYAKPEDLHYLEKDYVDTQISYLKRADDYPYEREILRSYMYYQRYKLNFKMSSAGRNINIAGYFSKAHDILGVTFFSPEMGLKPHSGPHTWMHELGHSVEFEDKLIDEGIEAERTKFVNELYRRFTHARTLDEKEQFIKDFGEFFDFRATIDSTKPFSPRSKHLLDEIKLIRAGIQFEDDNHKSLVDSGLSTALNEINFDNEFRNWVQINYLGSPSEVFADAVAGLIINPKLTYKCFGESGKQFLSKIWTKLIPHFEEVYSISLIRPKKVKRDKV